MTSVVEAFDMVEDHQLGGLPGSGAFFPETLGLERGLSTLHHDIVAAVVFVALRHGIPLLPAWPPLRRWRAARHDRSGGAGLGLNLDRREPLI